MEPETIEAQAAERSLTIEQLCKAEQFSRQHYYNLRAQGLGPTETRFGSAVRITPENRRKWHRVLEENGGRKAVA